MNIAQAIKIRETANGFWVPQEDTEASQHVENIGLVWEQHFITIPHNIGVGDEVIDVGAWVGDSTRAYINKGCTVHAFEPQFDSFVCLCLNCPESDNYNLALGKSGESYCTIPTGGNTGARMLMPGQKRIVQLDAFNFSPSLIKVDVEGYEVYVLDGARQTIRTHKPIIQIEVNKWALDVFGFKEDAIDRWLEGEGYSRHSILASASPDLFEAVYLPNK